MIIRSILFTLLFTIALVSCKKQETIVVPNNKKPNYSGVSTLQIENYIQRLFIDLLGREASDIERNYWTSRLKNGQLSDTSRNAMIEYMQLDTTFRFGDSSYRHAYVNRIYQIMKIRFLEGASDPEIGQRLGNIKFALEISRLNGDSVRVAQYQAEASKYEDILFWPYRFNHQLTTYENLCTYLMYNGVYDLINMGSFNFVNAAYEDALLRLPSESEFNAAFQIIEKNEPQLIFGKMAQNKQEFIQCLIQSSSFVESQVRWWYFQYLRKEIPHSLLWELINNYSVNKNLEWLQRQILKQDAYAQF